MIFTTDKQTLDDLNIFGKPGSKSVYSLFNKTSTQGGALILEEMFQFPLANEALINNRSSSIQLFQSHQIAFPFDKDAFDILIQYLKQRDERSKLDLKSRSVGNRFNNWIAEDKEFITIKESVTHIIILFQQLSSFLRKVKPIAGESFQELNSIEEIISDVDFQRAMQEQKPSKLALEKIAEYDAIFRFQKYKKVQELLRIIFYIDVYCSVASVAIERNFCFPKALPKNFNTIELKEFSHPHISGATANDLIIDPSGNVIFLTGANMAGKSTLMKSLGIAVLLAHMGFPVSAKSMQFSVREGLFTSINLADNLSQGASHFYAEVLRIKKVAREVSLGKNLFVVFDELFRGTNVKDAYDATIAITTAFSKKRNCMFIVSTHIMEAGEVLAKIHNINFLYLPTRLNGSQPVYTYRLEKGITEDRQGMIIIQNEGILALLDKGVKKRKVNLPK